MTEERNEIVKMETWVLCLCDFDKEDPVYYYNHVEDVFERKFNNRCAYWDEKSCVEKRDQLNLDGLQMFNGLMDFPRNILIDCITEVFEEVGLIVKEGTK